LLELISFLVQIMTMVNVNMIVIQEVLQPARSNSLLMDPILETLRDCASKEQLQAYLLEPVSILQHHVKNARHNADLLKGNKKCHENLSFRHVS